MKISLLTLALSFGAAAAKQLSNDPGAYFGAVNHESYLNWLITNDIEAKYNASVYIPSIDPGLGAAVHWSVDTEYIHFAVAARASGWVGFGLSDAGGMLGSDMALFSVNRPNEIVDAHVVETFYPREDDCQRDWTFVSSNSTSGPPTSVAFQRADPVPEAIAADLSEDFIMFETRRKLVTDDPQDMPIVRDNLIAVPEQRIIAAWGDSPDVSFHGTNVARGSIRVFEHEVDVPTFDESMAQHANGSFFVGARNHEISSDDTTYVDFCITRNEIIAQGVPNTTDLMSIIGFRPILDDGPSAPMVHHYVMTGIFDASDNACEDGGGFDLVYVWAPGDGEFALPDFLGGNLFGSDGFQGFSVEIHYDNPRMVSGVVDNSGVEVFYTTTPRPVAMGVLQIGDPFVALYGSSVGNGLAGHHFECPGSCSDLYLSDGEPVTVIREYLHMHVAGERITNEHIRNGTVIRTASTEVWDFDQNGNVPVRQQPYEIQPGDSFRTSCYYRGDENSVFGLSSRQEMCIAFLYYYPRKTYTVSTPEQDYNLPFTCGLEVDWLGPACNATYESEGILESDDDIHRLFGKNQCFVASDGTAEDPVVDVTPEEPAAVPSSSEAISAETETETASSAPQSVPEPAVPEPVPAPAPLDDTVVSNTSSASLPRIIFVPFVLIVAALI